MAAELLNKRLVRTGPQAARRRDGWRSFSTSAGAQRTIRPSRDLPLVEEVALATVSRPVAEAQ